MIKFKKSDLFLLLAFLIGLETLGCSGKPTPLIFVQLTPKAPQMIDAGQSVAITASVPNDTTGSGVSWTLSPPGAPGMLNVMSTSAATYFAPPSVNAAVQVTVTATSIASPSNSTPLSITVQPAPQIQPATPPPGFVGTAYTTTINATGGVAPYTWSLSPASPGPLPPGLSLSNSTTNSVNIAGTPTTVGTFTFTIQIVDSVGGAFTSAPITITIEAAGALRITSTSPLPNAAVGAAYSFTFAATGGTSPFTWSRGTAGSSPMIIVGGYSSFGPGRCWNSRRWPAGYSRSLGSNERSRRAGAHRPTATAGPLRVRQQARSPSCLRRVLFYLRGADELPPSH